MVYGIGFKATTTFTASGLPLLPHPLPIVPSKRFLVGNGMEHGNPDLPLQVTGWSDLSGATTLTAPTGKNPPALSTINERPTIRFNGTSSTLAANLPMARPHSVAAVFWLGALPAERFATILGGRDAWLAAAAGGYVNGNAGGSNGNMGTIAVGWHTLVASFDGTTTTVRINGAEVTRDIGQGARTTLTLGGTGASIGYEATIAYTEVALWGRSLSATTRAETETALRTQWGL